MAASAIQGPRVNAYPRPSRVRAALDLLTLYRGTDILRAIAGEVAEWLNAPVSKTGRVERLAGVRISPSPLHQFSLSAKPLSFSGLAFLRRGLSLPLVHI